MKKAGIFFYLPTVNEDVALLIHSAGMEVGVIYKTDGDLDLHWAVDALSASQAA